MNRHALAVGLLATTLGTGVASATMLDPNFTEGTFVNTGVQGITGMAWAPDGSQRLFLTVKNGPVRIIQNGVLLPAEFATISPVFTASECGVIGLAFDPNFTSNRYVYFFVTVSSSEQQIIRYTANGNVGTAKTTIVPDLPTRGANHDGGGIAFGPDGKLYWGVGDNGNGTGVDQNLTSLAAKIGRANADGSVPTDNPFYDGNGPNADLTWARGFRNPFTLTFQPGTERLWVNTVGTAYEQVFVPQRGDHAGYNDYENNQPAGYITPVIVYRTNGTDTRTITASGAVRSGGVATFTTSVNHGFRLGGKITIEGVSNASFNGTGYVSAVPSPTQFSIAQAGANASSGGGTAETLAIGGAITGGAFWDSTAIPVEYRGNYFFGDYNSGRIERVTLNSSSVVTSVDHWASGFTNPIDIDVGPDGNLYYVNYAGLVRRAVPVASSQALVVSRRFIRMTEGGTAAFNVRLRVEPTSTVNVSVSRASGDTDVGVSQGAALSFSTTDWSVPKPVTIAAAADADTTDDAATFEVASAGLATENVVVRVTDDNSVQPPTDGGTDAAGGSGGTGATGGSGGTGATGGSGGTGGTAATGGSAGSGGTDSGADTGGEAGSGGIDAAGGSAGTGGAGPDGGLTDASAGTGGLGGSGGASGATGSGGSAGASTSGGSAGAAARGGSGGRAGSGAPPSSEDDSGCGCRTPGERSTTGLGALALLLALGARRRRRGRAG